MAVDERLIANIDIEVSGADNARKELERLGSTTKRSMDGAASAAEKSAKRIDDAFRKVGVRSTKDIQKEITSLQRAYRQLAASGSVSARDLARAQMAVNKRVKELKREMTSLGTSGGIIQELQRHWLAVSAAIFAASRALGEYLRFTSKMNEVNTLLSVSEARFKRLTEQVVALSTEVPQSATQLARGLYDLISAGAPLEESIHMLELAAKAAVAGVTDTQTAIRAGMAVINAYGMSVDKLENVYDILFQTVRLGVTTFEELAQNIGMVLPTAKVAGVEFSEVAASLAVLTKAGLTVPVATTALANGLRALAAPTEEAKQKLRELGITWNGLIGTLQQIQKLHLGLPQLREIVPDVRAARAVITLTNHLDELMDVLNQMRAAAGSTGVAFQKQAQGLDIQLKLAMNRLMAIYHHLVGAFTPALLVAVKVMGEFLKALDSLPGPLKALLTILVSLKVAVTAWTVGSAALSTAMTTLGLAAREAAGGVALLNMALKGSLILLAVWAAFKAVYSILNRYNQGLLETGKAAAIAAKATQDQIHQLEALKQTLLNTEETEEAHIKAEEELARVLPEANTYLDDRGRLLAKVSKDYQDNIDLLNQRIALLKEESRVETARALESYVLAFERAKEKAKQLQDQIHRLNQSIKEMKQSPTSSPSEWENIAVFIPLQLRSTKEAKKQLDKLIETSNHYRAEAMKARAELVALARSLMGLSQEERSAVLSSTSLTNAQRAWVESLIESERVAQQSAALKRELQNQEERLQRLMTQRREVYQQTLEDELRGNQRRLTSYLATARQIIAAIKQEEQAQRSLRNTIKNLDEQIYNVKRSTAEKIRAIERRNWTEEQKQAQLRQDYLERIRAAEEALSKGYYERAQSEAQAAQDIAARIKDEWEAKNKVKEAGELQVKILQEQKKAAEEALNTHIQKAEELKKKLEDVNKATEETKNKIAELQQKLDELTGKPSLVEIDADISEAKSKIEELQRQLDELERDISIKVDVETQATERHRFGGLAGWLKSGGRIPGWGGGDIVPAMLEPGEYVLRKEAVQRLGINFLERLNQGFIPPTGGEVKRFEINLGGVELSGWTTEDMLRAFETAMRRKRLVRAET